MNNKLSITLLAVLATSSIASAQAKMVDTTMRGTLTDSMCKMSHAEMIKMGHGKDAASCTLACMKEGSELIFIDAKTKAAYSLQNAGAAQKFAGKKVAISGHVDTAKKVIHIHGVKASS